MINHARTLLLNTSPRSAHAHDAGYEYIPAAFQPLELSLAQRTIYKTLFGLNPDQRFLNMRSRELLSYVHQTELAEYVYKLDPRVTYWPAINSNALQPTRQITVTQVAGVERQLVVAGDFAATNARPQARQQYFVALTTQGTATTLNDLLLVEDGNFFTAEDLAAYLSQESASGSGEDQALAVFTQPLGVAAAGITTPVLNFSSVPAQPLPNTNMKFTVSAALSNSDTATGQWLIDVAANPAPAITTILPALELLGEPVFLELFGVSPVEPMSTFKNIWFDHPLPAYRLAGFVLAYIYQLENSRRKNNG